LDLTLGVLERDPDSTLQSATITERKRGGQQ